MKIIRLSSENVKRLTAVEITPDGTIVTIGGKNGAGKSSVLDSIAYALGGEKLVPAEPIRTGASDAKVVVDLGEFTVTRRFYREKFPCNCPQFGHIPTVENPYHHEECQSRLIGETKSTLVITNKDGARYPSPQKMLDGLLGQLTFDPLEFSRKKPATQNEILRQLTSLDFSILDTQRKAAYDRRSMHNQALRLAEGKMAALPSEHVGVPVDVIPIEEISAEIKKAEELQRIAGTRAVAVDRMQRTLDEIRRERDRSAVALEELRKRVADEEKRLKDIDDNVEAHTSEAEKLVSVADEAKKAVPDFEQLDKRLREIDEINTRVRANKARLDQQKEVDRIKALAEAETETIKRIDAKKGDMLEAAQFPVEGLGLTDDGVTFNNIPLEQASASEQLRVSIAIGLAINPKLKVLLIRNGNLLDEDNLKLVSEMAQEAQAQVWMEFVSSSGEGMTVMMEDGHAQKG